MNKIVKEMHDNSALAVKQGSIIEESIKLLSESIAAMGNKLDSMASTLSKCEASIDKIEAHLGISPEAKVLKSVEKAQTAVETASGELNKKIVQSIKVQK